MMIQPITGPKFNSRTSFKGFYDPTCISVPASMKSETLSKAKEVLPEAGEKISALLDNSPVQASLEHFKANFLTDSPIDATKILDSGSSHVLDATNIINEHTGVITHILPDGTPFNIDDGLNAVSAHDVGTDDGVVDSLISLGKKIAENIGDIADTII